MESSNAAGKVDKYRKEKVAPYMNVRAIDAMQDHAVGLVNSAETAADLAQGFAAESSPDLDARLAAEHVVDPVAPVPSGHDSVMESSNTAGKADKHRKEKV